MSLVGVSREQRLALLKRDAVVRSRLLETYAEAWDRIEFRLEHLQDRVRREGPDVPASVITEQLRLQELGSQIQSEVNHFAHLAGGEISEQDNALVRQAMLDADTLIREQLKDTPPEFSFTPTLPQRQLIELSERFKDGEPLAALIERVAPYATAEVRKAMIFGVTTGQNPKVVAKEMARIGQMPLHRATLIARTEMMRLYRDTTLEVFKANKEVVRGWQWMAALDKRTCPSCWSQHGSYHRLGERMETHPACRCTMVPVMKSWKDLKLDPDPKSYGPGTYLVSGAAAFAIAGYAVQRAVLGPGRFNLYARGKISLQHVVQRTIHPRWGGGSRTATILKTIDKAKADDFRVFEHKSPVIIGTRPDGTPIFAMSGGAPPRRRLEDIRLEIDLATPGLADTSKAQSSLFQGLSGGVDNMRREAKISIADQLGHKLTWQSTDQQLTDFLMGVSNTDGGWVRPIPNRGADFADADRLNEALSEVIVDHRRMLATYGDSGLADYEWEAYVGVVENEVRKTLGPKIAEMFDGTTLFSEFKKNPLWTENSPEGRLFRKWVLLTHTWTGEFPDALQYPDILEPLVSPTLGNGAVRIRKVLEYVEKDAKRRVAKYVDTWAATAAGGDVRALAMQRAVRDEMELELAHDPIDRVWGGVSADKIREDVNALYELEGAGMRAFVRVMYDHTQEYLANLGIEYVPLIRGMRGVPGYEPVTERTKSVLSSRFPTFTALDPRYSLVDLQPASSFSASIGQAVSFGEDLLGGIVPRSRILCMARTGFGCLHEEEFVILGGPTPLIRFDGWLMVSMHGGSALAPFMNYIRQAERMRGMERDLGKTFTAMVERLGPVRIEQVEKVSGKNFMAAARTANLSADPELTDFEVALWGPGVRDLGLPSEKKMIQAELLGGTTFLDIHETLAEMGKILFEDLEGGLNWSDDFQVGMAQAWEAVQAAFGEKNLPLPPNELKDLQDLIDDAVTGAAVVVDKKVSDIVDAAMTWVEPFLTESTSRQSNKLRERILKYVLEMDLSTLSELSTEEVGKMAGQETIHSFYPPDAEVPAASIWSSPAFQSKLKYWTKGLVTAGATPAQQAAFKKGVMAHLQATGGSVGQIFHIAPASMFYHAGEGEYRLTGFKTPFLDVINALWEDLVNGGTK